MPNINKLAAGDSVYVGEKLLTVTLVDPIRLFVNAKDDTGSIIEFRPWQLHVPAKKEEGKAQRKGRPQQEEDAVAVEESVPKRIKNSEDSGDTGDGFFFTSVLRSDGVFVRIGGTYFVRHLLNVILVVTNITGYKDGRFIVDFSLPTSEEGVLKDIVKNFNLTLGIEHVVKEVTCKKSSKVSTFVSNLLCDGRCKVSVEISKNNSWYKSLCRKFHVGPVLRTNIRSSINKLMGTSATVNIGASNMSDDLHMFSLNARNKYQIAYSMSDFCKLDDVMGCKWDIRPHVEGDLCSFFQYVSSVVVYLDKSDILKVKFKYAGSSFPVCDDYRERCMVSAAVRSQSFLNETADDTVISLS